jgi:hypothetical protein
MTKELAKELIEKWVQRQINLYGAENFNLPIKDEVIYSYCNESGIVQYTLLYCMSVYVGKVSTDR